MKPENVKVSKLKLKLEALGAAFLRALEIYLVYTFDSITLFALCSCVVLFKPIFITLQFVFLRVSSELLLMFMFTMA